MLYFPWRKESDLLGNDGRYSSKLGDQFVKETVARNRLFLEPYCEEVETAQELLSNTFDTDNIFGIVDPCDDQNSENGALMDDDLADSAYSQDPSHLTQESTTLQCTVPMVSYVQPTILDSEELHSMIRSLNQQQRLAFDTVLTYCRNVVKCPSDHNIIAPQLFITGGAGAGKSHFIKTIYQMATQTFKQVSKNPEKPSTLLLSPTGISAINIYGTTIDTGLSIPVVNCCWIVSPLPDIERSRLRNQLSELKMIIIDEISIASNMKLLFVHQRLKDIFGTPQYSLFAGKAIIAVGDLFQHPPCKGKPVFLEYSKDLFNLCHP